MPEDKNAKTVDIDTSGPGAEVELDVKLPESNEIEVSNEKDNVKSIDTSAQSNEQSDVQTSKQETENKDQGIEIASEDTDNKKELEDYSEGVKKRIAKLTKKMREAERQREAAIEYARKIQVEKDSLAGRLTNPSTLASSGRWCPPLPPCRASVGGGPPHCFWRPRGLTLIWALLETTYRMVYYDELTGLPGRRALNEALLRVGSRYAVAMVDVDHFKRLNDVFGHDVGDQALRMVAGRLSGITGGGKPFRYGGEEFVVLFARASAAEALPHLRPRGALSPMPRLSCAALVALERSPQLRGRLADPRLRWR